VRATKLGCGVAGAWTSAVRLSSRDGWLLAATLPAPVAYRHEMQNHVNIWSYAVAHRPDGASAGPFPGGCEGSRLDTHPMGPATRADGRRELTGWDPRPRSMVAAR
jgi:hypothetical protein